jgi:hypothetical protein
METLSACHPGPEFLGVADCPDVLDPVVGDVEREHGYGDAVLLTNQAGLAIDRALQEGQARCPAGDIEGGASDLLGAFDRAGQGDGEAAGVGGCRGARVQKADKGSDVLGLPGNEITGGATVCLPVETPGAFLYFGDCKAAMGNGEITAAPEVATRIVASATPVPRPRRMNAARVRTSARLTTVVSGINLADACRTAFAELKGWLEDSYGLTSDDAAVLMGIGAHCGVCQVSNALRTAQCSISLSLLPSQSADG